MSMETAKTDEGLTASDLNELHRAMKTLDRHDAEIRRALRGLGPGYASSLDDVAAVLKCLVESPLREPKERAGR